MARLVAVLAPVRADPGPLLPLLVAKTANTIKAHLQSIYRKLGAARRREAVTLARERGIL